MIRVVFDFVDTRTCHHAADLRLFPKCEQIGLNIEMFAAPIATSHPHAALHFVENEKDIVLVAHRSQLSEPFLAEMIVASSPWIGSIISAQISIPRCSMNSRISRSAFCSRSITSASRFDSGNEKSMCGHDTRGQSNFANKSVFRGSVLVRLIV